MRDAILCDRRPQETFNQQIICAINFTSLPCLLSLHSNVIGRVEQRAGVTRNHEGNVLKSHTYAVHDEICATEEHGNIQPAADCATSFTPSLSFLHSYVSSISRVSHHTKSLDIKQYLCFVVFVLTLRLSSYQQQLVNFLARRLQDQTRISA